MYCGDRMPNQNGNFLGKRNCCEGLTCISFYGGGSCEKGIDRKIINIRIVVKRIRLCQMPMITIFEFRYFLEYPPCRDACHSPGISVNGTYLHKSYLEVFPDGCRKLPKNHGIYLMALEDSLKRECKKSCGCKKCNFFNECIE